MTAATLSMVLVLLGLAAHILHGKMMMPTEFVRCHRNDPNIDACLQGAVQDAIPVLVRGLPRLNMGSIDPLQVTQVNMVQDFGPVNIVLNLTDFTCRHLRNTIISSVRSDVNNYLLEADLFIPGNQTISGHYGVRGNVFILPIRGEGDFTYWLENTIAKVKLIGERRDRNGVEYMHLKKYLVDLNVERFYIQLDNLFDGNKAMGKYANDFMNRYSAEIFQQMKPIVNEATGRVFQAIAARFYDKVPYEQIYL